EYVFLRYATAICSVTLADVDAKPPEPVPTGSMNDAAASVDTLTPFVPTGPPPTRVRRSRWRVAAAVVLATFPLLCVVGIPLAFHSYDTSTRPDRSTPIRAVDNFLHAFLGDPRDDASAGQLTCALPPGVDALRAYRTTVEAGERRTGQDVSFTWVEDDRV